MSALIQEMSDKAQRLGIPLAVQLDLTYRCNERCVHCYLDHDDRGEMNTAEIKELLEQMAEAGVFFLTLSGGEIMMRRDFFEIVEHARRLSFCVKLKTNAVMIRQREADRCRRLRWTPCRSASTRTAPRCMTPSPSCRARSSGPSRRCGFWSSAASRWSSPTC